MNEQDVVKIIEKYEQNGLYGMSNASHTHNGIDSPLILQTVQGTQPTITLTNQLSSGTAITFTYPTRNQVMINNVGVTRLVAGTNVTLSSSTGAITIYAAGGSTGTPAGANTQIQFNDSSAFGADPNFVWDKVNQELNIGGNTVFRLPAGSQSQILCATGTAGSVGGELSLAAGDGGTGNANGGPAFFNSGNGSGSGNGGTVQVFGGNGGTTGAGGNVEIVSGTGNGGSSNGTVTLYVGGSLSTIFLKTGADVMTPGGTVSLNTQKSSLHTVVITGNATINATTAGIAGQVIYVLVNVNAASSKTVTFNTNFIYNTAITVGANKFQLFQFVSDGTAWYIGALPTDQP